MGVGVVGGQLHRVLQCRQRVLALAQQGGAVGGPNKAQLRVAVQQQARQSSGLCRAAAIHGCGERAQFVGCRQMVRPGQGVSLAESLRIEAK